MTPRRRAHKTVAVTPAERSPTVRRRRLARLLTDLREQAGLSPAEAARELEWATTTVHRIEAGTRGTSAGNVIQMLELYGSRGAPVTEDLRREMVQLAKDARKRGWWVGYGLDDSFALYVGLETEAAALQTYQVELVHGLLQTEAYARTLRRAGLPAADPDEIDRWVAVRMRRQRRLTGEDPLALWVILSEAALRRQVGGPEVMTEQLRSLTERAELPNVTLQVLPFAAGPHPAVDSPFSVLTFTERTDQAVVYVETATENLYLEDPQVVGWHTLAFNHLRALALPPSESVVKIQSIIQEIGSGVDE